MNNELRKRFPAHAGLNADWSVCAWQLGTSDMGEHWLLENEANGLFDIVCRVEDNADGCGGDGYVETLIGGLTVEEAAKRLGLN